MSKTFALWMMIVIQTVGIIVCFGLAYYKNQFMPIICGLILVPLDYYMYVHVLPSTKEHDRKDKEFRKWMRDNGYSK